jgi:hypothetical protein
VAVVHTGIRLRPALIAHDEGSNCFTSVAQVSPSISTRYSMRTPMPRSGSCSGMVIRWWRR